MKKISFASVLVSTLNRHEYHYGDIEAVKLVAIKAEKEIKNHRIERVNLWTFPNEEHMLTYIAEKKAYYEGLTEVKFFHHMLRAAI